MWAKQKGFTVVELLIVIIVIGILAVITVVAYNGIQANAENVKTTSAVSAYVRALGLHVGDKGNYPIASYPCLGPTGTTCANVTDSTGACNSAGAATYNATFASTLAPYTPSLPSPSKQQMDCGGKMYSGAWYNSADGKAAVIHYYLKGNVSCPSSIGNWGLTNRVQQNSTTVCIGSLPTLQ